MVAQCLDEQSWALLTAIPQPPELPMELPTWTSILNYLRCPRTSQVIASSRKFSIKERHLDRMKSSVLISLLPWAFLHDWALWFFFFFWSTFIYVLVFIYICTSDLWPLTFSPVSFFLTICKTITWAFFLWIYYHPFWHILSQLSSSLPLTFEAVCCLLMESIIVSPTWGKKKSPVSWSFIQNPVSQDKRIHSFSCDLPQVKGPARFDFKMAY